MTPAPGEQRRSPSHLTRATRSLAIGVLIAFSASACTSAIGHSVASAGTDQPAQHTNPVPNATDAARLQTIAADPLFAGSSVIAPTPMPDNAGYNLQRGQVVTVQMGGDPNGTVSIASAHAELERVRAAGWTVVGVHCTVDPGFSNATLYAVKSMGSFTAALEDSIYPASHTTSAFAPFHSEKAAPWTPGQAVTTTCIDGPNAPTATTEAIDTNIGQHAQV